MISHWTPVSASSLFFNSWITINSHSLVEISSYCSSSFLTQSYLSLSLVFLLNVHPFIGMKIIPKLSCVISSHVIDQTPPYAFNTKNRKRSGARSREERAIVKTYVEWSRSRLQLLLGSNVNRRGHKCKGLTLHQNRVVCMALGPNLHYPWTCSQKVLSCPQECATIISHSTLNPIHDRLIQFNFYFFPWHFTLFQFYIFKSSQGKPSWLFLICTGTIVWYWEQNGKERYLHYHSCGLGSNLCFVLFLISLLIKILYLCPYLPHL